MKKILPLLIIGLCVLSIVRLEWGAVRRPHIIGLGESHHMLASVARDHPVLMLAMAPGCEPCEASLAGLKTLITDNSSDAKIVVAVTSSEAMTLEHQLLAEHSIIPDALLNIDFRAVGIPATPTILLLDAGGTVRHIWNGPLAGALLEDVKNAL